jgi:hypothetical protein
VNDSCVFYNSYDISGIQNNLRVNYNERDSGLIIFISN